MAQYIDKSALVAEIERLREEEYPCDTFEESTGYYNALDEVSSSLDTLEVKEVDLEKEIQNIIHKRFHDYYGIVNSDTGEFAKVEDMVQIAKYFFELDLKAQKGEKI